jgi:hypothetical protein
MEVKHKEFQQSEGRPSVQYHFSKLTLNKNHRVSYIISFVNCCPSNLLSGSTLPPSPLPYVNKYTVCRQCVRGGGVWGSGPQTDKHLLQSPITGRFFLLPSMSLIFLCNCPKVIAGLVIRYVITYHIYETSIDILCARFSFVFSHWYACAEEYVQRPYL